MKTYNFRDIGTAHIYIAYLLQQGYDFKVKCVSAFDIAISCPKACAPPPTSFLRPDLIPTEAH